MKGRVNEASSVLQVCVRQSVRVCAIGLVILLSH